MLIADMPPAPMLEMAVAAGSESIATLTPIIQLLIEEQFDGISFHVCPLLDNHTIEESERFLIQQYKPKWNVALTR